MRFSESYLRLREFEDVTVKQAREIWKTCSLENWVPRSVSFIVALGVPIFLITSFDRVSIPLVLLLALCLADLVELALMRPYIREYLQTKKLH